MAAPLEIRMKQTAVIEFLLAEGKTLVNIHKRLQSVYRDKALDYNNVRKWACHLAKISDVSQQSGYASLKDKSRTGRPSMSTRVLQTSNKFENVMAATSTLAQVGGFAQKPFWPSLVKICQCLGVA